VFSSSTVRRPPTSPLFPYTTLFRSCDTGGVALAREHVRDRSGAGRRIVELAQALRDLGIGHRSRGIDEQQRPQVRLVLEALDVEIGRAHVLTPVTDQSRMPSSA